MDMGGMDGVDGMGAMDGMKGMSMMKPYFHFTMGDILWFKAWAPSSAGTVFAACFGLFLLSVSERFLNAIRAIMAIKWEERARRVELVNHTPTPLPTLARAQQSEPKFAPSPDPNAHPESTWGRMRRLPSTPAHDLSRGLLFALQSALGYLLMLAVMTFNVFFIISILTGLGVGETIFGRVAAITPSIGH
ncbi:uncharacterized protein EI90DRAFT_2909193 [Cantharellus anzutake]|uniref:uncharacterized protein n=1 Tax=Cantharellus anzutake TaxID=1750568 RepID=UPI00190468B1|nr:uncharacterized protein EI90DRAFT_2909193 [Cantharellus anzutake]KAF8338278.1 hypothetical protein EI90DRAFT_2909193 [Cantharellus anzutake]